MSAGRSIDPENVEDPSELVARIELLEAENERLRRDLSDARQARYRRAATGTSAIAVLALVGALLFPEARTVLLALGGTGLFTTVLIRYLTPERFISARIGRRIYEALSGDHEALVDELALTTERVYVPIETAVGSSVRLFVPQHVEYAIPDDGELESVLVLPTDDRSRGLAFEPTGGALVDELQSATSDGLGGDSDILARRIADGLVEVFELVDTAEPDVDTEAGRISIEVADSVYGPVDRFDHPVTSTIASAIALERDAPVSVDVHETNEGTYVVTCRPA